MLTIEHGPTLTELLSQADLEAVIARFYDKVYADTLLAPVFAGVSQAKQQQRLAGFIRMTRGRSNVFDGAFLHTAHERLRLTPAHFARRETLLAEAITESGHGPEVVRLSLIHI